MSFIFESLRLSWAKKVLKKSDLKDADLRYSILIEADLSNANLSGANLRNVDFTGADLTNVNLLYVYPVDSIFDNANLMNAKINTCLEHDMLSRILNKILRSIEDLNLEFFEQLIISACK